LRAASPPIRAGIGGSSGDLRITRGPCALFAGSKPALASCSQIAAGGDCWLLMALRGHLGGALVVRRPGSPGDRRAPIVIRAGWCRQAWAARDWIQPGRGDLLPIFLIGADPSEWVARARHWSAEEDGTALSWLPRRVGLLISGGLYRTARRASAGPQDQRPTLVPGQRRRADDQAPLLSQQHSGRCVSDHPGAGVPYRRERFTDRDRSWWRSRLVLG
jgi:hypothetical protein